MTTPKCSSYKMWIGPEVEGHTDLLAPTLFVRDSSITASEIIRAAGANGCKRVWFCEEYENFDEIKFLLEHGPEYLQLHKAYRVLVVPKRLIHNNLTSHIKLDIPLRDGDHVHVGEGFQDESFMIGTGRRVNPSMYQWDREVG